MRILIIQPSAKDVNEKLPYPYQIDMATGNVLRQDLWKGNPRALVGFAPKGRNEIHYFLKDIKKGNLDLIRKTLLPVFAVRPEGENDDQWQTFLLPSGFELTIQKTKE